MGTAGLYENAGARQDGALKERREAIPLAGD